MNLRAFLAVELDARIRAAIAAFAASLGLSGVRWVPAENLHVTMRFLGDVPAAEVHRIARDLETELAGLAPFAVALRGAGVFPPHGAPRVLWVGLDAGRESMAVLASRADAALARWGLPPENRSFTPHVTIGRFRSGRAPRVEVACEFDAGELWVDGVTLFESRLGGRAPEYLELARIRFDAVR